MTPVQKLTELFKKFPGIGPRQAGRFVYYILRENPRYAEELSGAIADLRQHIQLCADSYQYFYSADKNELLSPIARDASRDSQLLMVVEKDSDLEAIEKTGMYRGYYFVLGGTIPFMEKEPDRFIRSKQLKTKVEEKLTNGLNEVILALSATPDGDATSAYIAELLAPHAKSLKLSTLARGLSTGSELEYIDKETLRNALSGRK